MNNDKYSFETQAIRGAFLSTPFNEHSPGLFLTSSYTFDNAEMAADVFSEKIQKYSYSRFDNPTVRMFEKRMALLENGAGATATSTGMGAILTLILSELSAGDHVVCARNCFGSTLTMFGKTFAKFGIKTTFVSLSAIDEWQAAIQSNTKMFFLESPANPLLDIADIKQLSDLAHQHQIKVAVDNCFSTPYLQQPLEWGADFSLHSATKYIDGQGRALGGCIVSKYPQDARNIYHLMRSCGTTMGAFDAWIFLRSLETLAIRMDRHCENALYVAQWLSQQPAVKAVHYPGLESHPQHQLAKKQMPRGFGGMISFEVEGDQSSAWKVIDNSEWLSITGNLGDVRTTITHPDTTTHLRVDPSEKEKIGITSGIIRLSVGLENKTDICKVLEKGLNSK